MNNLDAGGDDEDRSTACRCFAGMTIRCSEPSATWLGHGIVKHYDEMVW